MKKVIAFYLPQFHEFEENNRFWGKGYTEWTCLDRAVKKFKRHELKRPHPDIGYYDLNDINIRKKQAILAKKYGIYGFCYYHYWFGDRLLMQKPLELFLLDNEPDIPFCFQWVNESWTRRMNGGNNDVLVKMKYGEIDEWASHLEYLLLFFKKNNYILIDNKPVLIIYRLSQIPDYKKRFNYWNNELKKHGFDGIFIVLTLGNFHKDDLQKLAKDADACVEFFPNWLGLEDMIYSRDKTTNYYNIKDAYERILTYPKLHERQFRGLFVGFDNSPRRPNYSDIFLNASVENFGNALKQQLERSEEDYIFIYAWNEWGENAVLEPDVVHGYDFLAMLSKIVNEQNI